MANNGRRAMTDATSTRGRRHAHHRRRAPLLDRAFGTLVYFRLRKPASRA
jgi:hypothetical protein